MFHGYLVWSKHLALDLFWPSDAPKIAWKVAPDLDLQILISTEESHLVFSLTSCRGY